MQLNEIAKALVIPGKGILAADESFPTIEKRFAKINLPSTEENRRAYREMLFTTKGTEEFISGVIMFDETIRQKASDGTPFPEVLSSKGIIPGIKVDQGTESMPTFPNEKVTKGLDGLPERLKEYVKLGAKFTKWHAVITIGEGLPTDENIRENARRLAQFAKASQDAGLVPIVEPEVLMDGSHTMQSCEEATSKTLQAVFEELKKEDVVLEGTLLKTNMVLPGKESGEKATPEQIAEASIRVLNKTVPAEIPGVVFLSGGQSEAEATANLNALNKMGKQPWELSFSFARGLQDSALKIWNGNSANIQSAQVAFYKRAELNGLARAGNYRPEMENA